MNALYAFDPGLITGIAVGSYSDSEPYELDRCMALSFEDLSESFWDREWQYNSTIVIEKFIPNPGNQFTLSQDDIVGVQVEGMLKHVFGAENINWQLRSDKGKAGVMDKVLKEHGLWQTGDDVNWIDGRDANDAIIHSLVYLRNIGHEPTLRKYFRNEV